LDLADSNDIVRVEMIRPVTGSEIAKRISNPGKPVITLVPNRNNAYNTTGQWRRVIAPIEISANETNVFLRFFFRSDATGSAGGWYIDDVAVIQGSEIVGTYTNGTGQPIQLLGENFNGHVQDETAGYNEEFQFGLLPLGNYQLVGSGVTNVVLVTGPTLATNLVANIAAPPSHISALEHSPPMVITWAVSNGFVYGLQSTTNLMSGAWSNLTVQTSAVDGILSFTDSVPNVEQYFRVTVTNAP
ncbi:MAG: hypothetical protein KDL10_09340, partial [Kiritimatiellae bacterium]|nr:hypothetical protein [Kiritimatiellia bacterium]